MTGTSRARAPLAVVLAIAFALSPVVPLEAGPKEAAAKGEDGCRIRARITAADGKKAVADAVLKAFALDTGKIHASAPSTEKGECVLEGLPYGYLDLAVETKEGHYVGKQVVNVPPRGTLSLIVSLTGSAGAEPTWGARPAAGSSAGPKGVANVRIRKRGREFWTSPWGIAIVGVAATAILLSITGSEEDDPAATAAE